MASIQRRSESWRAVVRRTGYPTQISTHRLKSDAEAWARKIEREMDQAEFSVATSYKGTAKAILEDFRDKISPSRKGHRWEKTRINKLIKEPWLQKPVNKITKRDVADWRDAQRISGSSVRREMNLLSSVFNHAIKEWSLPINNPMKGVRKPKEGKARDRRPSAEELGAIRSHFENKKPQMLVAMELAIETAMREGELFNARLEWIDLKGRCIKLPDTKNSDARAVPLSSVALKLLTEQVARARLLGQKTLFSFKEGAAGIYWREAMKELKIDDLHFHDLRHEAITRMVPKFPNILELAKVTGHRDLRQLQRYYNPTVESLAAKLDA